MKSQIIRAVLAAQVVFLASCLDQDEPIQPCTMADAHRIIALSNMGYTSGYKFDLKVHFGKNAQPMTINAEAHAAAIAEYFGYLSQLREQDKISDTIQAEIMKNARDMDRCVATKS